MTGFDAAIVLFGAFAGGFVNGLTGFGTGLVGVGIWLQAVTPPVAATLAITSSVVAQIQALPLLKRPIDWEGIRRFLLPGLIATPIGTAALAVVDARTFKLGIGAFLAVYASLALSRILKQAPGLAAVVPDALIGFLSGFLGGVSGLSGALIAFWTDIRGDPMAARRALLQIFNLGVLALALATHVLTGLVTHDALKALAVGLPGTLCGAWAGGRAYRRLGERDYRRLVLGLLLASGCALLAGNAFGR